MTEPAASPDKLAEVAGLAKSVADRILDAQIKGSPIPPEQITSLVAAARLLQDHGVEWPPLVEQVLHEFAERPEGLESRPVADGPASDGDAVTGLTRFFVAFRREKGLAPEA